MQLKTTTDYAIRTIMYLAYTNRVITSAEIAKEMKIPREYLMNLMRVIRAGGLVETFTGSRGGYALAKAPEDITLYDVIVIMEDGIKINGCLEDDWYCSRNAVSFCNVHQVYAVLQANIVEYLKGFTIADILKTSHL